MNQALARNFIKEDSLKSRSSVWGIWFIEQGSVFSVDNPARNRNHLSTLEVLFHYGANPNDVYEDATIWITFLRSLIEFRRAERDQPQSKTEWTFYFEIVYKFICYKANMSPTIGHSGPKHLHPPQSSDAFQERGTRMEVSQIGSQLRRPDLEVPLQTIFCYFTPHQSALLIQALKPHGVKNYMQGLANIAPQDQKLTLARWASSSTQAAFRESLFRLPKRLLIRNSKKHILNTRRDVETLGSLLNEPNQHPEIQSGLSSWLSPFHRKPLFSLPALRASSPIDRNGLDSMFRPRRRPILSRFISWIFDQFKRLSLWGSQEDVLPAFSSASIPSYWDVSADESEPLLSRDSRG